MDWTPYTEKLDNLFKAASFDTLGKMGYKVWGNEREPKNEGDDQYTEILDEHSYFWSLLSPEEKAHVFLALFQVSARGLIGILNEGNTDIVQ